MARPQTATIQVIAANAAVIAASQTPTGAFTLVGSPVTLDAARRVLATCAANDSTKTVLITGTNRDGAVISETLALTNASTSATKQDFKTVSAAVISTTAAGAITLGTNGVASTKWFKVSPHVTPFAVSYAATGVATASANVSFEVTLDETDTITQTQGGGISGVAGAYVAPIAFAAPSQAALTADGLQTLTQPVMAVRATLNSGGITAAVTVTVLQAGLT